MQIKNSFDKETREKLLRSFLYATLSGVSAGLTAYTNGVGGKQAVLIGVSALVSFLVNIPIQYTKGDDAG